MFFLFFSMLSLEDEKHVSRYWKQNDMILESPSTLVQDPRYVEYFSKKISSGVFVTDEILPYDVEEYLENCKRYIDLASDWAITNLLLEENHHFQITPLRERTARKVLDLVLRETTNYDVIESFGKKCKGKSSHVLISALEIKLKSPFVIPNSIKVRNIIIQHILSAIERMKEEYKKRKEFLEFWSEMG